MLDFLKKLWTSILFLLGVGNGEPEFQALPFEDDLVDEDYRDPEFFDELMDEMGNVPSFLSDPLTSLKYIGDVVAKALVDEYDIMDKGDLYVYGQEVLIKLIGPVRAGKVFAQLDAEFKANGVQVVDMGDGVPF